MISVVDDDTSICRALKRLLRSFGYEVQTFTSGSEFLAYDFPEKPECLILDIHMSGMTGFDLQQKLQEEGRNLPVIFITALDDDLTRQKASESGAVAFLRKPVDDQSLIVAIQKATSRK